MNYIVVVKDEQNELSFSFNETYEVTNFVKNVLERSKYEVQIINNMEE